MIENDLSQNIGDYDAKTAGIIQKLIQEDTSERQRVMDELRGKTAGAQIVGAVGAGGNQLFNALAPETGPI